MDTTVVYTEEELRKLLSDASAANAADWQSIKIHQATPEGLVEIFASIHALGLGNRIHALSLSENHLGYLPNGLFQGLTALQTLDVSHNQLHILPENIFQGLTALQRLDVSHNQLHILPENICQGLTALQRLDVSRNQLDVLPDNVFHELTELKSLNMSYNQLDILPDNVFHELTALEDLVLSANQLAFLPESLFQELTALKWLDLDRNHLSSLPHNLLHQLVALQGIDLFKNQFVTIPEVLINANPDLYDLTQNFQLTIDGECHVLAAADQDPPNTPEAIFEQLMSARRRDMSGVAYALHNETPWGADLTEDQKLHLNAKLEEAVTLNKQTLLPLFRFFKQHHAKPSYEPKLIGTIQKFLHFKP